MCIIVQKYGGTSVSTDKNREKVSSKIIESYQKGNKVVVVVSAIGRKGDPYSTDSLISLIDADSMNSRELDILMSCGETISSVVLSNLLSKKGYDNIVLNCFQTGIKTNDDFGRAEVISVSNSNILKHLNQNKIVIIPGFQGTTQEGDITTLGRGGSDTTAVLIGEALGCDKVEIYTDVDGIMTADPQIVDDAKIIKNLCYSEVYQMAEDGAKVIHPKAVEIAERSNMKIEIKNSLKECVGTTISSKEKSSMESKNNNIITSITYKKNRSQVCIIPHDSNESRKKLMNDLLLNKISIDLINFSLDKQIFTIDYKDIRVLKEILDKYKYTYNIIDNCSKISVIGHRMRGIPGVMTKIVNTLIDENIDILQTSDSHTTIWCLVRSEDTEKAIMALHREFKLGL